MTSEFTAGVPVWRTIADALRQDIVAGAFQAGRLPTEAELASRFGVNRHTVRRAVGALVEQGLLSVEQGRGTFVVLKEVEYLLGRRTRFSENVQRAGLDPNHRVLSVETVQAGAAAEALGIAPTDQVIQIEMLGEAEKIPISLATHWFPAARFRGLPAAIQDTQSVTAALTECGISDYTRRSTRILARLPSEREALLLQQPIARPILQAEAINVDAEGHVIQSSATVFAGDRVQLVVEPDAAHS